MSYGITKEELHPSLIQYIQSLVGSAEGNNSLRFMKNTVTLNGDSKEVNIGIEGFNKDTDLLLVYKNSVYLEYLVDFTISSDNTKIVAMNGETYNSGDQFNFVALINCPELSEYVIDGSKIQDYSIDKTKLNAEFVQNIEGLSEQILQNTKKIDRIINVKEFKCDDGEFVKGDGIHDDTTGIQRAIDYCFNTGSVGNAWDITRNYSTYKLRIPSGRYLISNELNCYDYTNIEGDGRNSTLILCKNNNGFVFQNKYNFELKDFSILSLTDKQNSALKLIKSARGIIKNVCCRDFDIGYDFMQGFLIDIYSPYINYCTTSIKLDASDNGNGCHAISIFGGELAGSGKGLEQYGLWLKYGNAVKTYGTCMEGLDKAIFFAANSNCANILIDSCYLEINNYDVYSDDIINFLELRNCFITNVNNIQEKKYVVAKGYYGCKFIGCTFSKNLSTTQYHIESSDPQGTLRESFIENNVVIGSGILNISDNLLDLESLNGSIINNNIISIQNVQVKGLKKHLESSHYCYTDYKDTSCYMVPRYKQNGSIYYEQFHNNKYKRISKGLELINQPMMNNITPLDSDSVTIKNLINELKGKGYMFSKDTTYDTFLRYQTSLGLTDTRYYWSELGGNFVVQNGYARRQSEQTGSAVAVIEMNKSNVSIETYFSKLESATGGLLTFRFIDLNNHLFLYIDGSNRYCIYKRVNGVNTQLGVSTITADVKDKINVTLNGDSIILKVNDIQTLDLTESFNNSATKHGLMNDNPEKVRWSYYKVESLI